MTAATKSAYGEEWWKMHHIGASVCNECFLGLVFFFTASYLVPGSVNPGCVKVDPENTVAIGQFSSTLSYCQLHDQQADDMKLKRKLWKATRLQHHQLTMWLPGLVKAASLQHWRCLTPHPWNSEFQMQISLFCIMSQGSRKETAKDKEKLQISWAKDIPNAFTLRPMVVCWSGGVVMLLGNTSWTASQAIRTDRMWESLATNQCLVFGWLEW